jgi:hypothetical protein
MTLKIPQKWFVIDRLEGRKIVNRNIEGFIKENPAEKETIETAYQGSIELLRVFKFSSDTAIENNPCIGISAFNVTSYPKMRDIEFDIKRQQQGIQKINPGFAFDDNIFDKYLDKKLFKGSKSSLTIYGVTIKHETYEANLEDYNLYIDIEFKSDSDRQELLSILDSIKIE